MRDFLYAHFIFQENMNDSNINPVVYAKPVVEFVTVAHEFCLAVEKGRGIPVKDGLEKLQKILPLLYLKAVLLPQTEKMLDEELEKYVTEMDYNLLVQQWLELLGEYDSYYEVFDPEIQFGSETVTASISESLLDIYQDVKNFITAYSLGDEMIMNDALADCHLHFGDFWGQRLVNVLRAIHMLIFGDIDLEGTARKDDEGPGRGSPDWLDTFWGNNTGGE